MEKRFCDYCGKEVPKRKQPRPNTFCNNWCKGEWQRSQKPYSKEWLYQKYIVEQLSANDIAKIVKRDPKRVWEWIRDYGIETRKRGYLVSNHFKKGESYWTGKKHDEAFREKIRQARFKDGRKPYLRNGVHYLKGKRGADTPNWKGGITPERQKFYDSKEWKKAFREVWKRDNKTCQRCKRIATPRERMNGKYDVHHIIGFENIELRAELTNLVLLCEKCHHFVHSKKNIKREFLPNVQGS